METFSAPSFSLGLDLDLDLEEEPQTPIPKPISPIAGVAPEVEEEDPELETLDSGPGLGLGLGLHGEAQPRPALKRLRRGPQPPPPRSASPAAGGGRGADGSEPFWNLEDEIEDFSSQEEDRRPDICPSVQNHASCSSSKLSLQNRGFLSSQSACKLKTPKMSPASNVSTATNFESSSNKTLFPKLTVSPLRRIHLLDSDSDDPSSIKENDTKQVDASSKRRQHIPFQSTIGNEHKIFHSNKRQADLWKDFIPKGSVSLTTPALDEFCEEYFMTSNDQTAIKHQEENMTFSSSRVFDPDDFVDDESYQQKSISKERVHNWNLPNPQPPAYRYFYHDNPRIRALIRERLPYFVPLGPENHSGTQQFGAEHLDYMTQFGSEGGPSRVCANRKNGSQGSAAVTRKKPSSARRKPTSANIEEASPSAGSWVNPKSDGTIPKDAGKRRVSAVGHQAGYWFTGRDGRKVYITKNRQELTGQMAYRNYRKESGARFQKGKKKTAAKRKRKG